MDGEEDILLERALIVDDEFCKFNPAETPTNGHEYLLTVRYVFAIGYLFR